MNGFAAAAMALAMIASFVLAAGGVKLARARDTRGKGVLMLIAAFVLIGNVAILTL